MSMKETLHGFVQGAGVINKNRGDAQGHKGRQGNPQCTLDMLVYRLVQLATEGGYGGDQGSVCVPGKVPAAAQVLFNAMPKATSKGSTDGTLQRHWEMTRWATGINRVVWIQSATRAPKRSW